MANMNAHMPPPKKKKTKGSQMNAVRRQGERAAKAVGLGGLAARIKARRRMMEQY